MFVLRPALACALVLGALAPALPAAAETLYLKNGTQVTGTITKEDTDTFVVETAAGRRKVPKEDMEVQATADPLTASLTGLILAGAGHAYAGALDRAVMYFGLGAIGGAAGYYAAQQIRPASPSTAIVSAIVAYTMPMLVGAYDAGQLANEMKTKHRYRIDYTKAAE